MSDHTEPVLNLQGTHVYMHNEETGGDWECPIGYAEIALTRGWSYVEPRDTSLDGLFDPGTGTVVDVPGLTPQAQPSEPEQTGYDPAGHTVAEVVEYLDQLHSESPGEIARILEAEVNGKARVTVLNHFDSDTGGETA